MIRVLAGSLVLLGVASDGRSQRWIDSTGRSRIAGEPRRFWTPSKAMNVRPRRIRCRSVQQSLLKLTGRSHFVPIARRGCRRRSGRDA